MKLLWATAGEESLHSEIGINVSCYWIVGEVFDYLVAHGRMKEKEARAKFRQVCITFLYVSFPLTPVFNGEVSKTAVLCIWLTAVFSMLWACSSELEKTYVTAVLWRSQSLFSGAVSLVLSARVSKSARTQRLLGLEVYIPFQNAFPLGWFHMSLAQQVCNILEVVQM